MSDPWQSVASNKCPVTRRTHNTWHCSTILWLLAKIHRVQLKVLLISYSENALQWRDSSDRSWILYSFSVFWNFPFCRNFKVEVFLEQGLSLQSFLFSLSFAYALVSRIVILYKLVNFSGPKVIKVPSNYFPSNN